MTNATIIRTDDYKQKSDENSNTYLITLVKRSGNKKSTSFTLKDNDNIFTLESLRTLVFNSIEKEIKSEFQKTKNKTTVKKSEPDDSYSITEVNTESEPDKFKSYKIFKSYKMRDYVSILISSIKKNNTSMSKRYIDKLFPNLSENNRRYIWTCLLNSPELTKYRTKIYLAKDGKYTYESCVRKRD